MVSSEKILPNHPALEGGCSCLPSFQSEGRAVEEAEIGVSGVEPQIFEVPKKVKRATEYVGGKVLWVEDVHPKYFNSLDYMKLSLLTSLCNIAW